MASLFVAGIIRDHHEEKRLACACRSPRLVSKITSLTLVNLRVHLCGKKFSVALA